MWLMAFLVNFTAAGVAIFPFLIRDNGYFAMPFDFTAQELAFSIFMNDTIKEGNFLWNWAIDLGGNFLECFSFYNVGSIFFWITLLFPADLMPKVIGWMVIIKFAVAGSTSAVYFQRHMKSTGCVLIASLLYAFSGFQCSSVVFYHFQDPVALFPLLLIGLELLVEENKHGRLAVACLINVLCNYVFFVGEVLFLIIYYVVRYLIPDICSKKKKLREWVTPIGLCFWEGILGLASAGVLLFPAIHGTLSNDRVSEHLLGQAWFSMSTMDWLLLLKGLLMPAEAMSNYSSVTDMHWMTNAAYLPLFGVLFCLAYVITKKDWISNLLKICLVIAVIPVLNNAFMFFSVEVYRRWFYMPILIMALATARVVEAPQKYRIWMGTFIAVLLLGLYFVMTRIVEWDSQGNSLVFHRGDYYIGLITAIGGGCIALFSVKVLRQKRKALLCVTTLGFSAFVLFYSIHCYQSTIDNTNQEFAKFPNGYGHSAVIYLTETASKLDRNVLPYRYYFDEAIGHSYYNMALSNSLPSINSFISTVHPSVVEFYNSLDIDRATWTNGDNSGTRELLGARYVVSVLEREDYNYELMGTMENSNGQTMYLYENEDALPVCFTYDSYMTKSQFLGFSKEYRALVMLNTLVVEDEKAETVGDILEHVTGDKYEEIVSKTVKETVKERKKETCLEFETQRNGFHTIVNADAEKYAFFSVPYDESWKAVVNGRETEVLNINGLMAVRVFEGQNDIFFTYEYRPLLFGIICSIIAVVLLMFYVWISDRWKKKCQYSICTEEYEDEKCPNEG